MAKFLRKGSIFTIAFILFLAFSVNVTAAVKYETVIAPRVEDGRASELGSVLIRIQPLLYRQHSAWVSLPRDFIIREVSLTQATYKDEGVTRNLRVELHDEIDTAPFTVEPRGNDFLLSIPAQAETNEEAVLVLSFDMVYVPEGFIGDIMVKFEGLSGQLTSGEAKSALVPGIDAEEPENAVEIEPEPEPDTEEPVPEEPEPPVDEPEVSEVFLVVGSKIAYSNSQQLEMDVAPFIEDDRTFVPVRFIAEALGAEADWGPEVGLTEWVTLTRGDMVVTLTIGSNNISVTDGDETYTVMSDVAAQIVNDRTFLPARAVGEIFGAEFDWGPKDALTEWVSFTLP